MAARGWKITVCWALSANVNTMFRLEGPWKWPGAQEVMETEYLENNFKTPRVFWYVTHKMIAMNDQQLIGK
jgi:dimethylaniline monooxygenase (N-oxide forming)